MNLPILNRDFKIPPDGWHHLAALGEYPHTSGLLQILDQTAIQSIVNRFEQDAKQPNFGGLLVDFDHFSYDPRKSSEAAGWITHLQNRDDGLWGKIRWTTTGRQAVQGGEFRLISPVWLRRDTQPIDQNRIRPLRLDSAGLTNQPNIRGMAPLTNRDPEPPTQPHPTMTTPPTLPPLHAQPAPPAPHAPHAPHAPPAPPPAPPEIADLQARIADLQAQNKILLDAQIDADLLRYSSRFKPEAAPDWKAALLADRTRALKLLQSLPEPPAAPAPNREPIRNRADARIPNGGQPAGPDPASDAREAARLAREIKNRDHCTFEEAFNTVRANHPNLFGIS